MHLSKDISKIDDNKTEKITDVYEKSNINTILDNLPTTLFVTDKEGNLLLSNSFTAFSLGLTLEELLNSNLQDLIKKGLYNNSYALQAAKEKKPITGEIKTKMGVKTISTSTPILDNNGEVTLVITSSRTKELIQKETSTDSKDIRQKLLSEIEYLRSQQFSNRDIVIESLTMKHIYKECLNIAKTDCAVLITGESGTGKEVLANYIYENSNRSKGPFITMNCSAIPENLFESELFGYEKGAFTGANNNGKMGIIEIADEGTLFLDEISEMPLQLQAKLLRVLDRNEIRRIGGTKTYKVNFRLISATNKSLAEMVQRGEFREDLFYRINVIPIDIPPLRTRPDDLIALANMFMEKYNKKYGRNYKMSQQVLQYLLNHNWPGNVRELRNYIEREVVTNRSTEQSLIQNQIDKKTQTHIQDCIGEKRLPLKEFINTVEEQYIRDTLAECNGKVGEAAEKLGIHRTILYRKLRSFGNSI